TTRRTRPAVTTTTSTSASRSDVVTRPVVPVLVSIAAVLLAVGIGVWSFAPGPSPSVLSSEDRAALGGPDLDRGDPPPAVGYAVPDGAEAVARAYLVAAYAAGPSDAGRTR